ncbi:hypothetical protein LOK49_LG09G00137 [Camellia lanceoleosa]|uniref:Uncharacterized protein n=1 Tax=Camellia lanceoleosa TaxID=1840588 RepID=A0ACC0GJM8_9ERIC|nr:hypothetical protein LOK49_LG09G00137 [Camellia lanceoleosa]
MDRLLAYSHTIVPSLSSFSDCSERKDQSCDQQLVTHSRSEESLSVALPADLSVETPPISLWPPLPSPQNSSSQMLSHFPGDPPSHFPFYEMNPMLRGPIFVFGPHDESAGSQSQSQKKKKKYCIVFRASWYLATVPFWCGFILWSPSPCLAPIGGERVSTSEKRSINASNSFNSVSTLVIESADLVTALSGLNLSNGAMVEENHLPPQIEQDVDDHQNYLFNLQSGHANATQHPYMKKSESGSFHRPFGDQSLKVSYLDSSRSNGAGLDLSNPSPNKSYVKGSPASTLNSKGSLPSHYQHMDSANSSYLNYGLGGYSINTVMPSMMASNLPPLYENVAAASAMAVHGLDSRVLGGGLPSGSFLSPTASESQNLNRIGNQMAGNALQAPLVDPMYLQYLRTGPEGIVHYRTDSESDTEEIAYSTEFTRENPNEDKYISS